LECAGGPDTDKTKITILHDPISSKTVANFGSINESYTGKTLARQLQVARMPSRHSASAPALKSRNEFQQL